MTSFLFMSTWATRCLTTTQVDACLSAVAVIYGLALARVGIGALAADEAFPFSPSSFPLLLCCDVPWPDVVVAADGEHSL